MARGGIPRAQGGSSHDTGSRDVHLAERQREEKTILEFARAVRDREGKVIRHLDDAASVRPYCRKADEVAAVGGKGRILDWDCLYGQMTFLLERRGLTVVPFDLEESLRERTLWEQVGRSPIYSQDPVKLPFEAGAFDAVLSSGTLEHVADPEASLREIHRILRAGGHFVIYNLPNRLSWIEWIGLLRGTAHERRYRLREAREWLRARGFDVLAARHENVVPCTFSSLPARLRPILLTVNRLLAGPDRLLSRIPVLCWFGTNLTFICRKRT